MVISDILKTSYLVEKRDVSVSKLDVAINALKCYYGNVLKRVFIYEVEIPKKDRD